MKQITNSPTKNIIPKTVTPDINVTNTPGIAPLTSSSPTLLNQSTKDELYTNGIHIIAPTSPQTEIDLTHTAHLAGIQIDPKSQKTAFGGHWILSEHSNLTLDERAKTILMKLPTDEIVERFQNLPKTNALNTSEYVDLVDSIVEIHVSTPNLTGSHKAESVFNNHQLIGTRGYDNHSDVETQTKPPKSKNFMSKDDSKEKDYTKDKGSGSSASLLLKNLAKSLKLIANSLEGLAR